MRAPLAVIAVASCLLAACGNEVANVSAASTPVVATSTTVDIPPTVSASAAVVRPTPTRKPTPTASPKPSPTASPKPSPKASPKFSGEGSPDASPAPKPSPKPPSAGTTTVQFGYAAKDDAEPQITAATAAAKADGKNVLLIFGATWCGICRAMGATFTKPAVMSALRSYHVVQINVDSNMGLISKYNNSGSFGLPVIFVLDPAGKILVDTAKSERPSFTETGFAEFLRKWSA